MDTVQSSPPLTAHLAPVEEDPALALASWIHHHYSFTRDPLTHLKLQKLLYYCYAAAMSKDLEDQLGNIVFEAWKHGPVSRKVYEAYRDHRAAALPPPSSAAPTYAPELTELLHAVLNIYGRLSTFSIRNQSHLEDPWIKTAQGNEMEPTEMKRYYQHKWRAGQVRAPEYTLDRGSFGLDGLPTPRFKDLLSLSQQLGRG